MAGLPAFAADAASPFAMAKQYSADLIISAPNGKVVHSKSYVDGKKTRNDVTMNGVAIAVVVRKDQKKMYQIVGAQKMAMESDMTDEQINGSGGASFGPKGKFDLIGPDMVDGVACTKYKVTTRPDPQVTKNNMTISTNRQVFFFWLDAAHDVPVQMTAEDGSLTVQWKNFVTGPQDAALFEIPSGYKVIMRPALIPGG
jgi:Domain of unknown function (DUF4412)